MASDLSYGELAEVDGREVMVMEVDAKTGRLWNLCPTTTHVSFGTGEDGLTKVRELDRGEASEILSAVADEDEDAEEDGDEDG